ncbi:dnaJ (Hsp40) homolog 13 isoform 2-T2 [Aphomia sociella]
MYFMRRNTDFKSISTYVRFYSFARKNYYEVLNLRRNCSDKEIKDAFIQMSKEYHPDKNKDVKAQEKFVRVVEAYNVLGKPCSRAQYDSMFAVNSHTTGGTSYVYRTHVPYNLRNNPKYSYYYEHQSTTNTNASAKSSGTPIKKLPNYVIIMMCCGVALIGCLLQICVIREMYTVGRRQSIERSKYLGEELDKVRAAAQGNTNEFQT